jgi:hypothetical protein
VSAQYIFQVLSEILPDGDVSLESIAICGEIMTIESRLCSYGGVKSTKNVDQLSAFLDDHEALLQRSRAIARRFAEAKDNYTLFCAICRRSSRP